MQATDHHWPHLERSRDEDGSQLCNSRSKFYPAWLRCPKPARGEASKRPRNASQLHQHGSGASLGGFRVPHTTKHFGDTSLEPRAASAARSERRKSGGLGGPARLRTQYGAALGERRPPARPRGRGGAPEAVRRAQAAANVLPGAIARADRHRGADSRSAGRGPPGHQPRTDFTRGAPRADERAYRGCFTARPDPFRVEPAADELHRPAAGPE